jgi:lysozyme
MKTKMTMSSTARARLEHSERFEPRYYDDGGRRGIGNCTYGAGIKLHDGPCSVEELKHKVSASGAAAVFDTKVREAEGGVNRNVHVDLTQEQFDALVSLTFNCGVRTASKVVFPSVNGNDFDGAAAQISTMIYAQQKKNGKTVLVLMRGLIPRRAYESAPFRNHNK